MKLEKTIIIKIVLIGLIVGLVFYPWPSSDSYGFFSGFDSANLYISKNSNFVLQLNSSQINVKSVGLGVEEIHLALSDLPYAASFKITVQDQSVSSSPLRILIYYPLNLNQVCLLFSSTDEFIHLRVTDASGSLTRDEKLIQYSIGQLVSFTTKISTIQSSREIISISINNNTASCTTNLTTEVYSLLRDQARAISVEVTGEAFLAPGYLTLSGNPTWTVYNSFDGQGNSTIVQSDEHFSIIKGNSTENYVSHTFPTPVNWSSLDAIGLTVNGSGTNGVFRLWLNNDWDNRAFFTSKMISPAPNVCFFFCATLMQNLEIQSLTR